MKTNRQRGFTILELMITLLIGIILIGAAYAVYISQHRGFEKIEEITSVVQASRIAVDQLTRELHMAGFGVVTGETFTVAKKYAMTFLGDTDTDIEVVLAQAANAGDTEIKLDLRDNRDAVGDKDYVFINGGGKVEMVQVRQSGDRVNLGVEPDVIYLNAPLANGYSASSTLVRTIEQTAYTVTFPGGVLKRDNVKLVEGLKDLEFHYYDEANQEMIPDAVNGLNQIQRAAIRRVELQVLVGTTSGAGTRRITESVDLRNMGNRPFNVDSCKPSAPSSVTVSKSDTCEHFTVRWSAPSTNACDGTALTDLGGYKIYYGTASGTYLTPAAAVADETLTEYEVEDLRLENNTTYYVSVRAYDRSWNESDYSAETSFTLQDTQPPTAPTAVDASAGAGKVTITWQAPADKDVRGYRLYRGTTANFTANDGTRIADENVLDEEATSFTDEGLTPCVTYYYKVAAVDCANEGTLSAEVHGDGPGSAADVPTANMTSTTPAESPAVGPSAVSPFQAIARNQAIDLVWRYPAETDTAGVVIRYATNSYPASPTDGQDVGRFPGAPSENAIYSHTNLVNGTTYYYSAWAYDRCGNYSAVSHASGRPSATAPLVEIISPTTNVTISNAQMVLQARAYDPDQTGLHVPPSLELDNGSGIYNIRFEVSPNPSWFGFPRTDYSEEYCGFGGDANPCGAGDISTWCDGSYQLYAIATDDEGTTSASPFITVNIHNGGIYRDNTVNPATVGTYRNEVTFQIKNDATASAYILGMTPTWDHQDARLKKIQIPDGTTVWENSTTPAASGDTITFDWARRPTIAASGTRSVRLVFTRMWTTLSSAATAGNNVITPASTTGFSAGDTIYLVDGATVEAAVISTISSGHFNLSGALTNSFPYGATVRHSAAADDIQMTTSTIRLVFNYEKTIFTNMTCGSPEIALTFSAGPEIGNVQQDQPALNTPCSTTRGYIKVENYRTVPVHATVVDNAGVGISTTKAYYYVDRSFLTTAPDSGYASLVMTYSSLNSRWETTIPYQSDARVWVYFLSTDANGVQDRDPTTGAYSYDYITDTTAPACPLGITATAMALKRVDLTWVANSETDIQGYNVYRKKDSGSFARIYSMVSDENTSLVGVQYTDDDNNLNTSKYCYTYYVTAVDMQGNESASCTLFTARAGNCSGE